MPTLQKKTMFKKATTADKLFLTAAILSLVYSETLFFSGAKEDAAFVGEVVAVVVEEIVRIHAEPRGNLLQKLQEHILWYV